MRRPDRKTTVRLAWHAAALLLVAGGFALARGILSSETPAAVMQLLSDAFLLPGVLFAGFAGLSWAASRGAYDSLRYLFYNFALHTIWVTRPKKHYDSLYEYKTEKDQKGRHWFPLLLITGLVGIVLSLLFFVLYLLLL